MVFGPAKYQKGRAMPACRLVGEKKNLEFEKKCQIGLVNNDTFKIKFKEGFESRLINKHFFIQSNNINSKIESTYFQKQLVRNDVEEKDLQFTRKKRRCLALWNGAVPASLN